MLYKQLSSGHGREPATTTYLKDILKSSMVFVDVGANYGYYTLLAAKRCKVVFAFEPDPRFIPCLQDNVYRNASNVAIMMVALYDKVMKLSPSESGPPWTMQESEYGIKATTLDDCFTQKIDVIKIDVDGTEFNVLRGGEKVLTAYHPIVVIENHLPDTERDEMFAWLVDLGYERNELERRRYAFT